MNSPPIPERPLDGAVQLEDFVQSVSWSPDSASIAVAVSGGPIALLDCQSLQRQQLWAGHAGGTFAASFSPAAPLVASVGQDGTARWWKPNSSEVQTVFPAGADWVEQLAWAPDGSQVAVGAGRKVTLFQPNGTVNRALPPGGSTVTALAWRADSQVIGAANYGRVQRWKADSGEAEQPLPWKTSLISLSWSPDRRWVAAGTQEQSVQIWELPYRPGEELAMSGYSGKVREMAWHQSGRYLATGGGTEIMVWDCRGRGPAGTTPRILVGHAQRVTTLDYQQSGHLLASGGEDGRVLLWNVGQSTSALRQFSLPAPITKVAWSRDNLRLGIGCQDGTVAVVRVEL